MSTEPQSLSGIDSLRRLRRTLSLPLSKIKFRSNSYRTAQRNNSTSGNEEGENHTKKKEPKSSQKLHNSQRGKHFNQKADIRVSRFATLSEINSICELGDGVISGSMKNGSVGSLSNDGNIETTVKEGGLKEVKTSHKSKNLRPWPTQTIARALEGSFRKLRSANKYEHGAAVIKKVVISRKPGDVLGIYIKEVNRPVRDDSNHFSTSSSMYQQNRSKIVISRLAAGSVSEKQGKLKHGDEVLRVNHEDISTMSLNEVAAAMDYHKLLELCVRSKHFGINNNNECKVPYTSHSQNCIVPNGRNVHEDNSGVTTQFPASAKLTTSNNNSICMKSRNFLDVSMQARECSIIPARDREVIPSMYDNNSENYTVSVQDHTPYKLAGQKVEKEYDEAFQILLNAINSFDIKKDGKSCENMFSLQTSPAALNIESAHDNSLSAFVENLANSADTKDVKSDAANSIPQFPSVSDLFQEDPEYDEVAASDIAENEDKLGTGEEVGVDGCAHLFSSSLCHCNSNVNHNSGLSVEKKLTHCAVQHHYTASLPEKCYYQPTISVSDSIHSNPPIFDSNEYMTKENSPSIMASSDVNNHTILLHQCPKTSKGVTVGQRKGWFDKGAKVSDELQKRIEGANNYTIHHHPTINESNLNHVQPTESLGQNVDSPVPVKELQYGSKGGQLTQNWRVQRNSKRSSSESSMASNFSSVEAMSNLKAPYEDHNNIPPCSPIERSPRSLYKISPDEVTQKTTESQQTKDVKIESNISIVPNSSQGPRHFWNRITSPPRPRKNKLSRKFTKKFRKTGGSETVNNDLACWNAGGSEPFSMDNKLLDRYHLEPGQAQRRLSRHFMLDNRSSDYDPLIKPLDLSEFKKYRPTASNSPDGKYSQEPIEGSLIITLYGARDLKKTVSEVYCVTQVDDEVKHRIRTPIKPCRGYVAWNECYEAKLEEAYELHITLYTWETLGKHKTLAKTTLPIANFLSKDTQGTPAKMAVKLEPRGTLYIKLSLEDPSSMAQPGVFGADLQSILDREQTGLPIPLIVHDCIREVEARGMSVVGIYRLCGSAIAKKELRKKYEENSKCVDLSSEAYPDVNVITGILKDFLRELPHPLFPPELLEAVTVAMEKSPISSVASISSPFDPTPVLAFPENAICGISEESSRCSNVLSLLKNERKIHLPPAERATLYALLNHLRKVSSNQEQNKMTCQNLAVCFGPVLLGSINIGPARGLDLTAAIGFKRHIQVLNYMVSNWPKEPVPLLSQEDEDKSSDASTVVNTNYENEKQESRRISRVSLTRRLSYVFPSQYGSNSSISGSFNVDLETRTSSWRKSGLSNIRRSGSLTNILESNLDTTIGFEKINDGDGYFLEEDSLFLKEHSITG